MASHNSQCKTTYLQVIFQVSGKYFPETSRFPKGSSLTHENIEILLCSLLNVTFMNYIKILQVSRFFVSKFSNLSNIRFFMFQFSSYSNSGSYCICYGYFEMTLLLYMVADYIISPGVALCFLIFSLLYFFKFFSFIFHHADCLNLLPIAINVVQNTNK